VALQRLEKGIALTTRERSLAAKERAAKESSQENAGRGRATQEALARREAILDAETREREDFLHDQLRAREAQLEAQAASREAARKEQACLLLSCLV